MSFDQDTAAAITPVLAMVGQEARTDANWTCHMLEAVADQVLPDFHRRQRSLATSCTERIRYALKLAAQPYTETDDLVLLAHAFANDESLTDALFWISKALEREPNNGELHRFKASILERMGRFKESLQVAHNARLLGADPDFIGADIDRIEAKLVDHLKGCGSSKDAATALSASIELLGMRRLTFPEFSKLVGRVISAYAKRN